jgi:hypothetical protein
MDPALSKLLHQRILGGHHSFNLLKRKNSHNSHDSLSQTGCLLRLLLLVPSVNPSDQISARNSDSNTLDRLFFLLTLRSIMLQLEKGYYNSLIVYILLKKLDFSILSLLDL